MVVDNGQNGFLRTIAGILFLVAALKLKQILLNEYLDWALFMIFMIISDLSRNLDYPTSVINLAAIAFESLLLIGTLIPGLATKDKYTLLK